jgi:MFS family permease
LWSGQAFSSIGNQMFPIILAMVALQRNSGATWLGVVLAVQGGAVAVGTILAASVGDKWRRSRVMLASDFARIVGVAVIAVSPRHLSTASFLLVIVAIGIAEGLFIPAYGAVMPRILSADHLQAGNALNSLSFYIAMVLGPAAAGFVIAVFGTGPALWIDVATFVFSLATLLVISERPMASAPDLEHERDGHIRRAIRDFKQGVVAVWERPWIAASIGMATLVMTFSVAPAFLAAPIEARDRLGGSGAYGAAFTALGVGSIVGSLIGGNIRTSQPGTVALCGLFTIFGAVGSLAFLPLPGVLFFWAVAGIGVTVFQVLWTTAIQKDVPEHLLGRVLALDWLGSQGLMPLGYALAGLLVAAIGVHDVLIAGALLVLIAAPLPLLVPGGRTFSSAKRP